MAYSTPHTFVTSEITTAAFLNGVGANTAFLYGDVAWTAPTFANSWVNFSTYVCGFRLIGTRVVLRGAMSSGTMSTTAFTLPVGYRPTQTINFATVSNSAFGAGTILTNGAVTATVGSNTWFSLENLSFDTL